jgi:starch phosphorylase
MQNLFSPNLTAEELQSLFTLASDLRWAWSRTSDEIWEIIDSDTWKLTRNPWLIINTVAPERLEKLLRDDRFREKLDSSLAALRAYHNEPSWYWQAYNGNGPKTIAYFSMEYGVDEALPLYAGGLGVLAGDHLKTASDLGIPLVGVGLLYYEGYVRQMLDANDWQLEFYPHNDSTSLPVIPVRDVAGGLLRVFLELPGRKVYLRVWKAQIGRVSLYLLDSNDPLNSPADQGITSRLYRDGHEGRLLQEMILGIGGWRVLEALGIAPEVCHLNEGHAAFAVLERARRFMQDHGVTFSQALWATRAGNVFTTHTPVAAAFDKFDNKLLNQYFSLYINELNLSMDELLALGRLESNNNHEMFNMTHLAVRGSGYINGVSKLHRDVSRKLFNGLFPRWPWQNVPVGYITNGVHMPTWDSKWSDEIWTKACGKHPWLGTLEEHHDAVDRLTDTEVWECRADGRHNLVEYARERLARQRGQHGAAEKEIQDAQYVLDPNALTLGFARRFTAYKRPNLLFYDSERLIRILADNNRPVQLIIAGKSHPKDDEGKRLLQSVAKFAKRPDVSHRVVFLEDYDISMAQKMIQGIDVWINTPRRTWEACGTSGMKVLVNGGLNLSELDGWWAEAYSPDVGWAFCVESEERQLEDPTIDALEAYKLYDIIENEIIPEFYDRDEHGVPRAWVNRIRASMAKLAPQFSSNRMMREYVEKCYLPANDAFIHRSENNAARALALCEWHAAISKNWNEIRFGNVTVEQVADQWQFQAQVYLGDIRPEWVDVQLFADGTGSAEVFVCSMERIAGIPGALNGYVYQISVSASRPAKSFVPRVIPANSDVRVPLEENRILWQR